MKTLLVTGGAGFIGSNFIRYWLQHEPGTIIINLDALTYAGNLRSLDGLCDPSRHQFIRGDIRDANLLHSIFARYAIDAVVHFAAETHVDRSICGPRDFIDTNIMGTFNLLECLRQYAVAHPAVHLHHVSTDEVYGSLSPDEPPFHEGSPYAPNSPYAASKAASDHLVRAYHRTYGLRVTISNCANNYGPCQFPEKLIPLVISNALQEKPLPVYGDGRQVRDWLHVEDHCTAIGRILTGGRNGESYAIGGSNQVSNIDLVLRICAILDRLQPRPGGALYADLIQFVPDRAGHDRRYEIDASKIQRELAWQPSHTFSQGLGETVSWYLSHLEWLLDADHSNQLTDCRTPQTAP
ncbi:MAG: dTDP-glucose 4,6-dehydratase [Anaerolineae bacterium]|nr:dTDP-glucose 4,6-dehydratase [Anaerolineae bacterium]